MGKGSNKRNIYSGLWWALTPKGKAKVYELLGNGLDYDLAFAVIDSAVLDGKEKETEIYDLSKKEILEALWPI